MLTSSIQQINTLFYILSNKAYIILSYLILSYLNNDITLLQETFITNANLLKIKIGLNIHIKKSVTSNNGRIMLLIFEFLEETYSICNIYAPNCSARAGQFKAQ